MANKRGETAFFLLDFFILFFYKAGSSFISVPQMNLLVVSGRLDTCWGSLEHTTFSIHFYTGCKSVTCMEYIIKSSQISFLDIKCVIIISAIITLQFYIKVCSEGKQGCNNIKPYNKTWNNRNESPAVLTVQRSCRCNVNGEAVDVLVIFTLVLYIIYMCFFSFFFIYMVLYHLNMLISNTFFLCGWLAVLLIAVHFIRTIFVNILIRTPNLVTFGIGCADYFFLISN